jgi:hypothetical protein
MVRGKEKTFTEALVDLALDKKLKHQQYMARLSSETLAAVIGRKGKLIVAGDEGGEFIFKVTPLGVVKDYSTENIRNEVWLEFETFQDIVIGELDPKVARARGLIKFTGDRSLYDSHEIMSIVEEWMKVELKSVAQRIRKAMASEQ